MIRRYSRPKMSAIWTEENRFQKMLNVEIACVEGMARLGHVPKEAVSVIKKKAAFDVERIGEIEKKTNHDVVAFLMNLSELCVSLSYLGQHINKKYNPLSIELNCMYLR